MIIPSTDPRWLALQVELKRIADADPSVTTPLQVTKTEYCDACGARRQVTATATKGREGAMLGDSPDRPQLVVWWSVIIKCEQDHVVNECVDCFPTLRA